MAVTINRKKAFKLAEYFALVVVGNFITAFAAAFFVLPDGLIVGGTTGLGIFIEQFIEGSAVSLIVFALNAVLFLIGALLLGKKFAFSTLLGTVLYPAFLALGEFVHEAVLGSATLTGDDVMLSTVCGGLLLGLGIGIVVRQGASTGGTDIPALIFNKFFGVPVSVSLWSLDLIIIAMQIATGGLSFALYGIIMALIQAFVVDVITPIGLRKFQVKIVSERWREIREMLLSQVLGVTVLYGQTGFLQEKCHMLLTVVSTRNLVKVKNEIQKIDPNAFLTISVVSEVRGRGYTTERVVLPPERRGTEDLQEVALPEEGEAPQQREKTE